MRNHNRKVKAHRASGQRHRDKRRDQRKAGKLGRVGTDSLWLTARHSMVPLRARSQKPQGLSKLVRGAVNRLIARHTLPLPVAEHQRQKKVAA